MERFDHFIGGASHIPASGSYFESINPFTRKPWTLVARGNDADATAAVEAAHKAATDGGWAMSSPAERSIALQRIAGILRERWEELVPFEINDNGKRISEVRGQFSGLHSWYSYFAERAEALVDQDLGHVANGVTATARYEPYGVVVAITPWNSPLMIAAWKIAPALAAGNTVIIKPSELASASTVAFARLVHEAGIPPGIINVVTGFGAEAGAALVSHPLTAKVTFTGSDNGGIAVGTAAARSIKPATLELGGKSPQIVFADADLKNAINGILSGIFLSNGQSCVAGSRLLVEASISDQFLDRLVERVAGLRPGDPMDPATQIAPIANEAQHHKVLAMIAKAKREGARCICGGEKPDDPRCGDGLFVSPAIFVNVTRDMEIWREEVFGPVLSVATFSTETEAIDLANDSCYGLAAGIWTSDAPRGQRLAAKIQAGTVYINHYRSVAPGAPIGGYKRSGYGRELGPDAIRDFQQTKAVWTGISPIADPFSPTS